MFQESVDATRMYKGVHFGRQTGARTNFGGKEGPGPGEYEPYTVAANMIVENLNNPDGADRTKFDSKIPRYHEWVEKEEARKVRILESCFTILVIA